MSQTVVRVRSVAAPNGQPALTFSVDGNFAAADRGLSLSAEAPPVSDFIRFQSDPEVDSPFVTQTGQALLDELSQHQNMGPSLASTLAADPSEREIQIEIQSFAKVAHDLPWEALFDGNGFLALEHQLPFTRIVPVAKKMLRPPASFDGTLRIFAVIGADGIPGQPQWDALRTALEAWTGEAQVSVLAGDTGLLDYVAENPIPNMTAGLVPQDNDALMSAIGDATPHILLLFCHGQSQGGGGLEIANNLTAVGNPPLYVKPAALAPALRSAWLVLLNACSTGETDRAANTNSFACTLVEQGVPFVTSMRQEVPADVAHRFTRTFLRRALDDLDRDVKAGQPFELRLSPALAASRGSIAELAGQSPAAERRTKEWTLPILCTAQQALEVRPRSTLSLEEAVTKRATIEQLRAMMPGLSPRLQAAAQAKIDSLEAELRA
jgi:hypothetical protein